MTLDGENRLVRNWRDLHLVLHDVWKAIRGANASVQPGTICALVRANGTAVDGWLPCDGRKNLSTAKYPGLFGVLGTAFGSDGTGMFGVPDLRDRALYGADDDISTTRKVGTYGLHGTTGTDYRVMYVNWYIKT